MLRLSVPGHHLAMHELTYSQYANEPVILMLKYKMLLHLAYACHSNKQVVL